MGYTAVAPVAGEEGGGRKREGREEERKKDGSGEGEESRRMRELIRRWKREERTRMEWDNL